MMRRAACWWWGHDWFDLVFVESGGILWGLEPEEDQYVRWVHAERVCTRCLALHREHVQTLTSWGVWEDRYGVPCPQEMPPVAYSMSPW